MLPDIPFSPEFKYFSFFNIFVFLDDRQEEKRKMKKKPSLSLLCRRVIPQLLLELVEEEFDDIRERHPTFFLEFQLSFDL